MHRAASPPFRSSTRWLLGALLALVVFLFGLLTPSTGRAGNDLLEEAVSSMFYASTTSPQVYESQRRKGYVAGAVSLRTPLRDFNILTFDPPRLRAGCAGIDLFGGSFSFINGEQLQQLIKQIGAAALSYAVYVAINEMCKPCGATIAFLQKLMSQLNSGSLNACKIAKGLVDGLREPSSLKETLTGKDSMFATIKNFYEDITESVTEAFKDADEPGKYAEQGADGLAKDNPDNPLRGNLVWRALFRDQTSNAFGDPATSVLSVIDVDMAEYMMSVTGTVVLPVVGENGNCPDTSGTGSTPQLQECLPVPHGRLLSFKQFAEGNLGGHNNEQYWKCTDDVTKPSGCLKLSKGTFTFRGIKSFVHKQLFGHDDVTSSHYEAGSLVDNVISGNTFTQEQIKFVNTVPHVPVLALMLKAARVKGAPEYVAHFAKDFLADAMVVNLGHAILKISRALFSGQAEVTPPPDWNDTLASIREDLKPYQLRINKTITEVSALAEYVDRIVSGYPSLITTTAAPQGGK